MAYILLILLAASTVASVLFQKIYRNNTASLKASTSVYIISSSVFGIIFFFITGKGDIQINTTTFIYAFIYAIICFVSLWGNIVSFDMTDLVYITLFSGAGGMIIPFLFEFLTGKESFSAMQIIAVIIRMIAIILPFFAMEKSRKSKKNGILICWLLFFISGISTVLPKLYSEATAALSDSTFCLWTNFILLPFVAVFTIRESGAKNIIGNIRSIKLRDYFYIVLGAVTGNIGTLLTITVLRYMSATVYTIIYSPLSMIFTVLVSVFMFKEKQTWISYICIALSVLAIVLYVV